MITVECSFVSLLWQSERAYSRLAENAITKAAEKAECRFPDDSEVSVLFTDDTTIADLNRQYRNRPSATNVLSFPSNEGLDVEAWQPLLGDIVLAYQTIEREAVLQKKSFNDHLTHLLIHGFLHLLGHDHQTDRQTERMENLEIEILATMNIANPYRESHSQ